MKKYLPYLLLALPFFLLKVTNIGIWLSDTNIYFYTGYQLLQGNILYKDIFFTNFPLLPYISALYFILTNGNLPLFFFTASIEVILVGGIIYAIILKEKKSQLLALLTASIYLYSFIVLATSNHQTGVFIASLFSIFSYLFFTKQRFFLSGIFIALALLTKAYFLPVVMSIFIYILLTKRSKLLPFLCGAGITAGVILLPSLILAPHDLFRDVISYSLTRSQGIPKGNITGFFLTHDTLFALLLVWNILMIKKRLFFGMTSLLSFLFFLLYQDIYYLYLNFSIPFLALSFPELYLSVTSKFKPQKMVLPTIISILLCINLSTYITSFRSQQKITNISELTDEITKQHPATLYGINSLTPALSYLTETPLLNGIIDTNENIFRKGFLDKKIMTEQAVQKHALIIANGAVYPESGINYPLLGGIFDEQIVAKSCRLLMTYPVQPEGVENAITLFQC
ncbi:MAG: hypothetical protein Q8Q49_04805 [bacterium]|nr:hypothetical protein [bacterium]